MGWTEAAGGVGLQLCSKRADTWETMNWSVSRQLGKKCGMSQKEVCSV
ncbi:hypothetical protein L6R29_05970 [Myxococcota bacterium]|nr:hypothetical protein [Myxococcota bacterium]